MAIPVENRRADIIGDIQGHHRLSLYESGSNLMKCLEPASATARLFCWVLREQRLTGRMVRLYNRQLASDNRPGVVFLKQPPRGLGIRALENDYLNGRRQFE